MSATTQALHRQLYAAVLGGRQSWFDANPTGRVLNRFTRDTEKIDENVPNSLASNPPTLTVTPTPILTPTQTLTPTPTLTSSHSSPYA